MIYRDYRYEPTIDPDGNEPLGCGFGLLVLAFAALIYWINS